MTVLLLRRLRFSTLAFLLLAWLGAPTPAAAQSCWMSGVGGFHFGTVNPHANADTSLGIPYTCQSAASTTYFRVCLYIAEGNVAGVAPRRMVNNNGAQLAFDLYTDAARSVILGPPPAGGGYAAATSAITIAGGHVQMSPVITVYGRIPGNQNVPGNWNYQVQMGNSGLYWAWSTGTYPPSCTSGMGTGHQAFFTQGSATVPDHCRISQVNDLDFGLVASVGTLKDASSQVVVRCPAGTAWNVGLGNGVHASGSIRRMRSSAGNYVSYELYRNVARTQRWGTTLGSDTVAGTGAGDGVPQTITIHGRVPAQASQPGGTYADTVTITLTY